MLKNLFKRTLLNKATIITFSIFLFIDIVILGLIMKKTYALGTGSNSFPKAYYLAFFWFAVIELLVISILIREVIFDSDINYLINVEKQYNIKMWKTYFYRLLVKIAYCFAFVSILLIFYFIFYYAIFYSNILASVFLSSSICYIVYLYLFSFLSIGLSLITIYVKNVTFKYAIPFIFGFLFLGISMSSSIFIFMNESDSGVNSWEQKNFQKFLGYEKDFENYVSFSTKISEDKKYGLAKYLTDDNSIIKKTNYDKFNDSKNNDEVKNAIYNAFKIDSVETELSLKSYSKYNYNFILFGKEGYGTPANINYNVNKLSISDVFQKLSEVNGDDLNYKDLVQYKKFFKGLGELYKDFEKNNMYSLWNCENYDRGDYYLNKLFIPEEDDQINSIIGRYINDTKNNNFPKLEFAIDFYIDKAQHYGLNEISYYDVDFYNTNFEYFAKYLKLGAYLNPYFQIYFMTMNKSSDYKDDLDRASYIGGGGAITRLKKYEFNFLKNNKKQKTKIYNINTKDDTKMLTLYYYEVTVIEYIVLLFGLNIISYFIFAWKNRR